MHKSVQIIFMGQCIWIYIYKYNEREGITTWPRIMKRTNGSTRLNKQLLDSRIWNLRISTWKCPWKVSSILEIERLWRSIARTGNINHTHLKRAHNPFRIFSAFSEPVARSPTQHLLVREIKMLKAVLISCPRKFIINNHTLSFLLLLVYRLLFKAPFFFFSFPRFCMYGSLAFSFFESNLFFFPYLCLALFTIKKITALAPRKPLISHRRIWTISSRISLSDYSLVFISFSQKKSVNQQN